MSEATASQEPSMEEILASIRRIISEEGQEQPAGGDALSPLVAPIDTAIVPKPQPPKPAPQPVLQPPPVLAEDDDDDDELVLTEVVTSAGDTAQNNVVPLKPDARVEPEPDFAAEPQFAPEPQFTPEPQFAPEPQFEMDPHVDLTPEPEAMDDDIELALDEPFMEESPAAGGSLVEPVLAETQHAEKPTPEVRSRVEAQPTPRAPSRNADEFTRMTEEIPDLVAPEVADAATASFAQLLQPARRTSEVPDRPTGDGLLVETLVRMAVEPMLKAWLDTHLEPIVERIVRREVERLARKAELN